MTTSTTVTTRSFGMLPNGEEAELITLRSPELELAVTSYGARVVSLRVPDRDGVRANIALGYEEAATYATTANAFFGATIGRFANRIAGGTFTLGGERCQVPVNNGENALHGGTDGYDLRLWRTRLLPDGVEFALRSAEGDGGFPGELAVAASYAVVGNRVHLRYVATATRTTVINLTNHTYFNLDGEGEPTILEHELVLDADRYTPVNAKLIPTGELAPVAGTAFDFTGAHRIGERIDAAEAQLELAGGYDHNMIVRGQAGELRRAARVVSARRGRVLEVATTEPGVQFYTGNFLDGTLVGSSGRPYGRRSGFCLETQHYPDSPNQPAFPSVRLSPGERFRSETVWTLSTL